MRKTTLLIAGLMTGTFLTACASNPDNMASSQDQVFATEARQGDQFEINTSQTAESRSNNDQIKAFAKKMISDHTYIDDQLKKAVDGTDVSLPDDFDGPHQAMVDHISGASRADFDRDYIIGQDKAHQEAIAAYQSEASSGTNQHLKDFAAQTLPVLQDHLAMLMKIEESPQFVGIMPASVAAAPGTTTTITTTTTP